MMDFLDNKYSRWYFSIIRPAQAREIVKKYHERHHILPRCMNGGNEKINLVTLTYREHYMVHWLLPKMVEDLSIQMKLNFALYNMRTNKTYGLITSGRKFESVKREAWDTLYTPRPTLHWVIVKPRPQEPSKEIVPLPKKEPPTITKRRADAARGYSLPKKRKYYLSRQGTQ